MASKRKSTLPVTRPGEAVEARPDKEWQDRERKYKAREALETIQKAEEYKKDKGLMKDVKEHAKSMMKAIGK